MGIKSYERVDEGNIRSACITLQGINFIIFFTLKNYILIL